VKRVLAKQEKQFNSLEITRVVSRRFLGIPFMLSIAAHSRHIQQGICLVPTKDFVLGNDRSCCARKQSCGSRREQRRREAIGRPHTALISGSWQFRETYENETLRAQFFVLSSCSLRRHGFVRRIFRGIETSHWEWTLTKLLERTEEKITDVKMIHGRPALIQEPHLVPPNVPGTSVRADSVEQILFSFYNGELYKSPWTYDRPSTEGLTEADMVKSISGEVRSSHDCSAGDRFGDERPI